MTSEIRVDKIHNEGGDNDSGLDMSTNDVVKVKIAGSEKVRVHSDGKVGIGEDTPLETLQITTTDGESNIRLHRQDTAIVDDDNYGTINWTGADSDSNADGIRGFISGKAQGTGGGFKMEFGTASGGAAIGSDPRMLIDADGNVGIGTDDPQEQFHSYHPDGSNRLRVTGVGNIQCKVEIGYDATVGPYIAAGSSGQNDLHIYVDRTVIAAEFRGNGDFYSNDGTVHSLSDIRIKKDVADLTDGLAIVKQLKPKTFKYTENSEYYNEKTKDKIKYGFVANEVEAVAPQYTDTGKGRIGGKEVDDFKTLSATKMIPMLVKAIQELEARVAALEAK
jgi:hypothetical protein